LSATTTTTSRGHIPQTDPLHREGRSINEEIERYRLGATNALLGRRDVVIVA
jgi:excinuclease UvrABC helicase subunit UvrB